MSLQSLPAPRRRQPATVVVLAALVLALLAPTGPAAAASHDSVWPSAEQHLVNRINEERLAGDLPTLRINLQMVRIGRDWSSRMAATDVLAHRPELAGTVFGPWQRVGENVGRGGWRSDEAIEAAMIDSTPPS